MSCIGLSIEQAYTTWKGNKNMNHITHHTHLVYSSLWIYCDELYWTHYCYIGHVGKQENTNLRKTDLRPEPTSTIQAPVLRHAGLSRPNLPDSYYPRSTMVLRPYTHSVRILIHVHTYGGVSLVMLPKFCGIAPWRTVDMRTWFRR